MAHGYRTVRVLMTYFYRILRVLMAHCYRRVRVLMAHDYRRVRVPMAHCYREVRVLMAHDYSRIRVLMAHEYRRVRVLMAHFYRRVRVLLAHDSRRVRVLLAHDYRRVRVLMTHDYRRVRSTAFKLKTATTCAGLYRIHYTWRARGSGCQTGYLHGRGWSLLKSETEGEQTIINYSCRASSCALNRKCMNIHSRNINYNVHGTDVQTVRISLIASSLGMCTQCHWCLALWSTTPQVCMGDWGKAPHNHGTTTRRKWVVNMTFRQHGIQESQHGTWQSNLRLKHNSIATLTVRQRSLPGTVL